MHNTQVHVRKGALTDAALVEVPLAPLAEGAVRLAVESFSVTTSMQTSSSPMTWVWLEFPCGRWSASEGVPGAAEGPPFEPSDGALP